MVSITQHVFCTISFHTKPFHSFNYYINVVSIVAIIAQVHTTLTKYL